MTDKPEPPPLPDWVEKMMPGHAEAREAFKSEYEASPSAGPATDRRQAADGTDTPIAEGAAHPFLTPVQSSNISGVAHDGQALWVKFLNGTLYRYPTAGADLHTGMLAAESAGSYFHKHIKSAHKGEKVS